MYVCACMACLSVWIWLNINGNADWKCRNFQRNIYNNRYIKGVGKAHECLFDVYFGSPSTNTHMHEKNLASQLFISFADL